MELIEEEEHSSVLGIYFCLFFFQSHQSVQCPYEENKMVSLITVGCYSMSFTNITDRFPGETETSGNCILSSQTPSFLFY